MRLVEAGDKRHNFAATSVNDRLANNRRVNERLAAFASAQAHTRLVRALKIAIPVLAIGTIIVLIVVTFFNPFRKLPNGVSVSNYGLDGTRITMEQPRLAGYHKNGQPYQLRAKSAQQDIRTPNIVDLKEMEGTTGSDNGGSTHLSAAFGTYDSTKETMTLRENVQIHGSSGYDLAMQEALIDFHEGSLISKHQVTAKLKNGTVLADSLQILENGKLISFDGHVKSVFTSETAIATPAEGNAQ